MILAVTAVLMMAAQIMVVVRTVQLLFVVALSTAGKAGTERVVSYAGELLGDLLAAFKHAAFLALVLVIWRLFSAEVGTGAIGQWLVLAIVLVVLVIKRESLWGFASNGRQRDAGAAIATRLAAGMAVRSAARAVMNRRDPRMQHARLMQKQAKARTRNADGSGTVPGQRALGAALAGPMGPHLRAPGAHEHRTAEDARTPPVGAAGAPAPVAAALGVPGTSPKAAGNAGVEVPAGSDALGQARADRARRVRSTLDERDALLERKTLDGEQEQQARTQLARRRGELARVRDLRGAERDPRKRQALRKREVSLQRRAAASQARLARSDRARDLAKEPLAVRREKANTWLRAQAKLKPGAAPHGAARRREYRNYPQLAGLAGSSARQYRDGSSAQQLATRAKVDRELRRHQADGKVMAKDRARAAKSAAPVGGGEKQVPYRKDAGRHEQRRQG
ncbi:hypothetical protein GKE82_26175 [Conexibacter sp. W3-3-2]|uniref:hypothetical protein n=1 Tax=Conexibacter sp. W3-3-2 TaxID=2675227 RepID=UPI0012B855F6|nr:hypothetical protein [Conexibacter sp. W3-3-2]MTD47693.1 hypothetical protein [Conexibacter sp. W3-3-2]